jgi:hypothetical protein
VKCTLLVRQFEYLSVKLSHDGTVGGFVEGPGVSEDLEFFYQHVQRGGSFSKVDQV